MGRTTRVARYSMSFLRLRVLLALNSRPARPDAAAARLSSPAALCSAISAWTRSISSPIPPISPLASAAARASQPFDCVRLSSIRASAHRQSSMPISAETCFGVIRLAASPNSGGRLCSHSTNLSTGAGPVPSPMKNSATLVWASPPSSQCSRSKRANATAWMWRRTIRSFSWERMGAPTWPAIRLSGFRK